MPHVYVTEPGAMIRARGTRLIIQRGEETLRWIPSQQVSQLVLVGPVQISYGARCLCLKAGLDVIFLNTAGADRKSVV